MSSKRVDDMQRGGIASDGAAGLRRSFMELSDLRFERCGSERKLTHLEL